MSNAELEQRSDAELRELADAPARAEAELARRAAAAAVQREVEAQAVAATWLLGNVRAIGGAESELDKTLERLRANPNAKDVATANGIWEKIVERLMLADVIQRRFPGISAPATPTVLPPGQRRLDGVSGLSNVTPARQLHPVLLATDSAELRAAIYASSAHEWLLGRGSALPKELLPVLAGTPPTPDTSERIARDRADTVRQQRAAFRLGV